MGKIYTPILALGIAISTFSCSVTEENSTVEKQVAEEIMYSDDPHSFSKPNEAVVKHLSLNISLDFDKKIVDGEAVYDIDNRNSDEIIFVLIVRENLR